MAERRPHRGALVSAAVAATSLAASALHAAGHGGGDDESLVGKFTLVADLVCSAIEYTDILQGRQEFTTYYRLLPWDHAAPALLLTEGGGVVEHLTGETYTVRSANQVTVAARNRDVSNAVRRHLQPRSS